MLYTLEDSTNGYPMEDANYTVLTGSEGAADFTLYEDAVDFVNNEADEYEDDGYECDRSLASANNLYAVRCEKKGESVDIQIILKED